MSAAESSAGWARSLEWRVAERLTLPPWAAGLLLTAMLIGIYAILEWAVGPIGPESDAEFGGFSEAQLGFSLSAAVAGYALAAGAAIAAGNAADLAALRLTGAVSGLDEPRDRVVEDLPGFRDAGRGHRSLRRPSTEDRRIRDQTGHENQEQEASPSHRHLRSATLKQSR